MTWRLKKIFSFPRNQTNNYMINIHLMSNLTELLELWYRCQSNMTLPLKVGTTIIKMVCSSLLTILSGLAPLIIKIKLLKQGSACFGSFKQATCFNSLLLWLNIFWYNFAQFIKNANLIAKKYYLPFYTYDMRLKQFPGHSRVFGQISLITRKPNALYIL